jgi:hydroxyquinol 1,2-dioxygenase
MMTTTDTTPAELARRLQALTDEVVASFDGARSPRAREVLQALVRHLHGFAREVGLTEQEWQQAIAFLARCGHITDERRQEFILLSDVLGVSMLTITINAPRDPIATEPTVFGPFFVEGSPEVSYGGDIAEGVSGERCWVEGRVTGVDGTPVAGATLEVWEADDDGFYDVQYSDGRLAGRAHTSTDADGRYGFWSVRPAPYPIPDDGPVGDLLKVAGRSPMRPAHMHFMVSARGYHRLVTHVFVAGDPHLGDDAVFGVKESLISDFTEHAPGPGPAGRTLTERWWQLVFDIRLVPVTGGNA